MTWIQTQVNQLRNAITDPMVTDTLKTSANNVLNSVFDALDKKSQGTISEAELAQKEKELADLNRKIRQQKTKNMLIIGGVSAAVLLGGFFVYRKLKNR